MGASRELPKGWVLTTVGFVFDKISNGANVTQHEDKIGLPISRIETIWNETIDFDRVKYIEQNSKEFIEKYALKNDDILFSHINSDSHLGKTAIFKKTRTYSTLIHGINLLLLRANGSLNADLINYYFKYLRFSGAFAAVAQKAVNQSSINQAKLKQFTIPLAPLPEQHRIVAKVEELFSSLDKGTENLKTAQQQLKVYRQAVLKWAFEGKLTNNNVVEGELPEGWRFVKLGDVSEMCLGKMLDKAKNKGEPQPYLRNISVRWGTFDLSGLEKMRFEKFEAERYGLMKGDLVICEGGEPGRCAIWIFDRPMFIQKALHRVRMHTGYDTKYVFYFIFLSALDGHLEKYFTGTTIKHLTGKELRKVAFTIPPTLEEQHPSSPK